MLKHSQFPKNDKYAHSKFTAIHFFCTFQYKNETVVKNSIINSSSYRQTKLTWVILYMRPMFKKYEIKFLKLLFVIFDKILCTGKWVFFKRNVVSKMSFLYFVSVMALQMREHLKYFKQLFVKISTDWLVRGLLSKISNKIIRHFIPYCTLPPYN